MEGLRTRFVFINRSELPTFPHDVLLPFTYVIYGLKKTQQTYPKPPILVAFKTRLHVTNFQITFFCKFTVSYFKVKIIWMKLLPRLTFVQIAVLINDRNVPKSAKINLIFEITESLH